ncbi:MAG TPA: nucleotidyltransferase [Egibacteraceae bacterium]|nr:nucleotidyltransferase [Egibacteraceae bacterium]
MDRMDRDALLAALTDVGRKLRERGVHGDLYLVGGAAMALAYDARRMTRDVDAVFEPKLLVYEAAAEVADERGLPPDWLNDGVKGFLPGPDPYDGPAFDLPGLRVQAASPQMLLALKVLAARVGEDDDDIAQLTGLVGLSSAGGVLDLVERIVGAERLTARSRFFVEAVLDEHGGDSDEGPG